MSFSFLSRFFTPKPALSAKNESLVDTFHLFKTLQDTILNAGGIIHKDFTLYYHNHKISIDLIIFLPHYGLFLGEKLSWSAEELQNAQIESSKKKSKKTSTTNINATEKTIRQKLGDVLSFDTTPIERFFWLDCLEEGEFDQLDESFHALMPKNRLLFKDENSHTILNKLQTLGTYQETAFSKLKTLGALSAHTLLLPTAKKPFGSFLSDEQYDFIAAPSTGHSLLIGDFGSGKTTALIRKALSILLDDTLSRLLIVTPTLLAGEIIRNKLISLADFAAIELNLFRLEFLSTVPSGYNLPSTITHILCDDYERLHPDVLAHLQPYPNLILTGSVSTAENVNVYPLHSHYRLIKNKEILKAKDDQTLLDTLLSSLYDELRKKPNAHILILIADEEELMHYKQMIDAYCGVECTIINAAFTLQRSDLIHISLSTPSLCSGISMPHVYLLLESSDSLYPLALSRASERVTIISENLSDGENDDKDR